MEAARCSVEIPSLAWSLREGFVACVKDPWSLPSKLHGGSTATSAGDSRRLHGGSTEARCKGMEPPQSSVEPPGCKKTVRTLYPGLHTILSRSLSTEAVGAPFKEWSLRRVSMQATLPPWSLRCLHEGSTSKEWRFTEPPRRQWSLHGASVEPP